MIQTLLALAMAQALPNLATEETKVLVPYADLNLQSGSDRAKLDRRILSAAHRACDEQRLPSAAQQTRIAACVATAQARARRDVEQAIAGSDRSHEVAVVSLHDRGTM